MRFEWHYKDLRGMALSKADTVLKEMAEGVLDESLKEVPRDDGRLAASGKVEKISEGHYRVSYGGGDIGEYAVKQHEDLSLKHSEGEKAKFLEDSANKVRG